LNFLHHTKTRTGFFWTFCIIQKHEPDFFELSASYKNTNRIFLNPLHHTKTQTGFFRALCVAKTVSLYKKLPFASQKRSTKKNILFVHREKNRTKFAESYFRQTKPKTGIFQRCRIVRRCATNSLLYNQNICRFTNNCRRRTYVQIS
jgi:hypothetical protein